MSHWWPKLRPCIKCGLLRMGLAGGMCKSCRDAAPEELAPDKQEQDDAKS